MNYKYYMCGGTLLRLRDGYWDYFKRDKNPLVNTWWSAPEGYVEVYFNDFKEISDAEAKKELFLRQL